MRQCSKCHCVEIVGAIDYRPISSGAVHDARHFAYHPVAGTTANTGPISSGTFKPDWASAPGETILDILQERKISQDEFGVMIGRPAVFVNRLISGEQPINKGLAKTLARFLGATPDFWLNRDASYVESLRRINVSPTRYSEPLIKSKE